MGVLLCWFHWKITGGFKDRKLSSFCQSRLVTVGWEHNQERSLVFLELILEGKGIACSISNPFSCSFLLCPFPVTSCKKLGYGPPKLYPLLYYCIPYWFLPATAETNLLSWSQVNYLSNGLNYLLPKLKICRKSRKKYQILLFSSFIVDTILPGVRQSLIYAYKCVLCMWKRKTATWMHTT